MMQLANKLTLHTDPDRQTKMMDLVTTSNPLNDHKGKRKMSIVPLATTTSTSPSPKKIRVFKDPFLQIVDYPTPIMETATGKKVDTEKTLTEYYSSLKLQASQETKITKEGLRSSQTPQLISALDKKSQMMKIVVIQPATVEEAQRKKIIEFKLNMNKFSVVDKVDFSRKQVNPYFPT